ncbi:MAG: DinB family protein, partial [Acidobacteria bacterium]|nr:DinB family protein [Acidobacteriota bacterium]
MSLDPRISLLLREVQRGYDHSAWHGPNLLNSIKGVTLPMAAWRPGPDRHNIWELAVHAAYWKYRTCRYIDPESAPEFGIPGSNFPPRPVEATEAAWVADLTFLRSWQHRLLAVVEAFDARRLGDDVGKNGFTYEMLISGVADHDIYHAGQI